MSEFTIALSTDYSGHDMTFINRRYAAMAVNRAAKKARTMATEEIPRQLNMPKDYVRGNITIGSAAAGDDLATEVTGKFRPRSLASFAKGTPESTREAGETQVEVAPGRYETIPRAFLIRLKGIKGSTEDGKANIGLAIRLRPGETIHNKRVSMMQQPDGLTLLYGPSVDQAFKSVRGDISADVGDFLAREYLRLEAADI